LLAGQFKLLDSRPATAADQKQQEQQNECQHPVEQPGLFVGGGASRCLLRPRDGLGFAFRRHGRRRRIRCGA